MGLLDLVRHASGEALQFLDDITHLAKEGPKSARVVAPWLLSPKDSAEFVRLNLKDLSPISFNFLNGDAMNYNREGDPTIFFRCGFGIPASVGKSWVKDVFPGFGINLRQYNFLAPWKKRVSRLAEKVDEMSEEKDQDNLIGIGHSLGGLTLLGASKVWPTLFDLIISIATPVKGAQGARWFKPVCKSLYDLRPEEVAKLGLDTLPQGYNTPEYFNICLPDDGIDRPFENSLLPEQENTTNLTVPGIQHNQSLYHPLIRRIVYLRLHKVPLDDDYGYQLKSGLPYKFHGHVDTVIESNQSLFV